MMFHAMFKHHRENRDISGGRQKTKQVVLFAGELTGKIADQSRVSFVIEQVLIYINWDQLGMGDWRNTWV